jgi:hypothetical protein
VYVTSERTEDAKHPHQKKLAIEFVTAHEKSPSPKQSYQANATTGATVAVTASKCQCNILAQETFEMHKPPKYADLGSVHAVGKEKQ